MAYTISDIFQLRIKDVNEIFTTFRIAEMPLVQKEGDNFSFEDMKKEIVHFV